MELYYYLCSNGFEPSEYIKELPLSKFTIKFYHISNIELPLNASTFTRLSNWQPKYSYNVDVLVKCMINNKNPDYMHLAIDESEDGNSWKDFYKHFCQLLIDYDHHKTLPQHLAYDDENFPAKSTGTNEKGYFHGTVIELLKND